jgi:glycosyltransferase involved in cell wall biosynthesis
MVRSGNDDVIDHDAIERSASRAKERVEVDGALANLVPRMGGDERPAILLAMPFLLVGGAERLLSEVVRHLTALGYRVTVVTTLHTDPAFGDATPWFAASTNEIYHLPRFLEPDRWRGFVEYLFETRRPTVLWLVGSAWFYELLPELERSHPELRVLDLLFNTSGHTANNRRFSEHIDLTLVESEEVERWLLEAGESPSRLVRIESGVDLEAHRPRAKDAARLAELGIPADAFVVGFSGRWSEEKAPEVFLEVAERFAGEAGVHFLMTGAGPLAPLVTARARAACNPRLQLLGQVEDLRSVMGLYDVLLLPSRLDGRPVVVLESLAMGIPVVASRVGDLPRLVRDGHNGFLCPPGDAGAFAQRVHELVAQPDLRRQMGREARRFAEAELDATRMLERYAAALSQVGVAAPRAPTGQVEAAVTPR